MHLLRRRLLVCLSLLALPMPVIAAEALDDDCPDNADGVAARVKSILGPQYGAADDVDALKTCFRELEILTLQAGHCTATTRSTPRGTTGRDQNIMEWHSINQWLSRLTNTVGLNARGDTARPWRAEYALFAEIYEFKP